MDNTLRLFGIAKKAGKLALGEAPTMAASHSRSCFLLLVARDAAGNTLRRANQCAQTACVPCLQISYTKAELGLAVGRSSLALLAVTDLGLAAAIAQRLAEADQTGAAQTAAALLSQRRSRPSRNGGGTNGKNKNRQKQ